MVKSYTATEAFGGALAPEGHREIVAYGVSLRCECGRLYSDARALEQHHEGVALDAALDRAANGKGKVVINGGEVEILARDAGVELVVERQADAGGPSMRLRLVFDPASADKLACDLLRASTAAREQS